MLTVEYNAELQGGPRIKLVARRTGTDGMFILPQGAPEELEGDVEGPVAMATWDLAYKASQPLWSGFWRWSSLVGPYVHAYRGLC